MNEQLSTMLRDIADSLHHVVASIEEINIDTTGSIFDVTMTTVRTDVTPLCIGQVTTWSAVTTTYVWTANSGWVVDEASPNIEITQPTDEQREKPDYFAQAAEIRQRTLDCDTINETTSSDPLPDPMTGPTLERDPDIVIEQQEKRIANLEAMGTRESARLSALVTKQKGHIATLEATVRALTTPDQATLWKEKDERIAELNSRVIAKNNMIATLEGLKSEQHERIAELKAELKDWRRFEVLREAQSHWRREGAREALEDVANRAHNLNQTYSGDEIARWVRKLAARREVSGD